MGRDVLDPHRAFADLAPAIVYFTGISWVLAGIVCFGYLYRLRREAGLAQQPPAVTTPQHRSDGGVRRLFQRAVFVAV